MTFDMVAWLLERIAEDEQRAKSTILPGRPSGWRVDQEPWETNGVGIVDDADHSVAVAIGDRVANHITTWDPKRALAECETKRKIIAQVRLALRCHPAATPYCPNDERCACHECLTIRNLSLPYADREDYPPQWKPGAWEDERLAGLFSEERP